jgi:EAL domain-containing protein (putative c-di-GMP-specific phosphodiesterase class I)
VALTLQSYGIEASQFTKAYALRDGLSRRTPDLVFLAFSGAETDVMESLRALAERTYRGPIQPIVATGQVVPEAFRQMAERNGLRVLPVLAKPMDRAAIGKVIREHGLDGSPTSAESIRLEDALAQNWLEFWYQPKIDLRKKLLSGVELFARVRHPDHGIIVPGAFIDDASENSLVELTERSLVHALRRGITFFSEFGVTFRVAVNVTLRALSKIPVEAIVREYRPKTMRWPGLVLDVAEEQISSDLSLSREMAAQVEACDLRLAIDGYGRGYLPLPLFQQIRFAEVKLDRSVVTDCATDRGYGAICKSMIDLAHNFEAAAVAVGVEKPADAHALFRMGCDLGQGHLFGQPMTEDRFIALLRQRAVMSRQGVLRAASA